MSKKKSFSGSTMTLKDFHGGSIPSDLPLPSAPGVIIRPSDRSGFDRQIPASAWGNPIGRPDHRSRPGSSGATRSFDEKAAFLSHPPHIGRNFDEDERKPFDGGVAAVWRRSVREDDGGVRPPSMGRSDPNPKPDSGKVASLAWSASAPASQPPVAVVRGVAAANSQIPGGNGGAGSAPNAWGMRREVVEPAPSLTLTGPSAVSKFAQASALEKISSGRWQSKPAPASVNHHVPDVEVISYSESEAGDVRFGGDQFCGIEYDGTRGRFGEGGGRDFSDGERGRSSVFYSDGIRPPSTEGKLGGSQLQSQLQAPLEASERPKLKLLPRSKPLESPETHVGDYKQVYQPPPESVRVEAVNELHGNVNPPKPGSAGGDGSNRAAVERPKLNLKPRSQPLEQPDGSGKRERKSLFGGARPRELVLKERGVDEVIINNLDLNQPADRVKQDSPKADMKLEANVSNTRYNERPESFLPEQRLARDFERKDQRLDTQKPDMLRGSWKNENRRNSRDFEKPHERQPEPESWRKPVEPPTQAPSEAASGPRYGKTASALELAQAFSRSVPDAKPADRFTSRRNLPGRGQVPFSRLTDTREFYSGPTPRQINGY